MIAYEGAAVERNGQRLVGPLDLVVSAGETVVLLGRSGAGKTTALRLVNALTYPTAGRVLVEERPTDAWDAVALRRRIGYVIQEIGLFPHLTVRENVGLVPRLEGWAADRIAARVDAMLDLVGLDPRAIGARRPHRLSGGQRQRVGVARALAADPPILLCDEPFGAVDPITRGDLQREFAALTKQLGKTVLFVTHDVHEALKLADRIALLVDGRVGFIGTPSEFLASDHPAVRQVREAVA